MTLGITQTTVTLDGNGVTTSFVFPFPVPTAADLVVIYTDASGNQTTLLQSQYSVAGIGNPTGGTVTYPLSGSPIATGTTLNIQRIVPLVQDTSVSSQGPTFAAIEGEFDYLTMIAQQLEAQYARTIQLNASDSAPVPQLPPAAQRAGQLLGFDSSGNPIVAQPSSALVAAAWQPVVSSATTQAGVALLNYLAGYTTSVVRLLESKLGDFVNVLDFGADPTGAADSAAAIQAAVNASLRVYLPAGTFKLSSAITLKLGSMISGAGPYATTLSVAFAGNAFQYSNGAVDEAKITIQDMAITGANASAVGISFVMAMHTRTTNVRFLGLSRNIYIDRGRWHNINDCIASGNATYQAGQLYLTSTSDADYCFFAEVTNYAVNTGTIGDAGIVQGVASPAIFIRRGVLTRLVNCSVDHAEAGAAPADFITLENDCQGIDIIGGSSYGAVNGVNCQVGSGVAVAPSYTDIVAHDVDWFSGSGINISGTTASTIVDVSIIGGKITAAQGATIPYINILYAQKVTIANVNIEDYTASHKGNGVKIGQNSVATLTNNIFDFLNVGLEFDAAASGVEAVNNAFTNCTTALSTTTSVAGTISRIVGNRGLNPFAIATPGVPASGAPIFNTTGTDVMVYLSNTTSMNVLVGPGTITTLTGPLYVSANNSVAVSYTTVPTWAWVPV